MHVIRHSISLIFPSIQMLTFAPKTVTARELVLVKLTKVVLHLLGTTVSVAVATYGMRRIVKVSSCML